MVAAKSKEEKRKTSRPEEKKERKKRLAAVILQRLSRPRALIVNLFCRVKDKDYLIIVFGLFKLKRERKKKSQQRRMWK